MTARQIATYIGAHEARRIAREAESEGRHLEIWSVRLHLEDRPNGGDPVRFDVYETDSGGIRHLEPPNFYEWPWGGYTEHQGTPWSP